MSEETYLRDDVYISLTQGMLRLRAGEPKELASIIYLEPETLDAINAFAVLIGFPIKAVTPKEDESPS